MKRGLKPLLIAILVILAVAALCATRPVTFPLASALTLGVPLTLAAVIVLDEFERTRWLATVHGGNEPYDEAAEEPGNARVAA